MESDFPYVLQRYKLELYKPILLELIKIILHLW